MLAQICKGIFYAANLMLPARQVSSLSSSSYHYFMAYSLHDHALMIPLHHVLHTTVTYRLLCHFNRTSYPGGLSLLVQY
jgi:hypothetical protein